jgi:hypothetical protein
MFRIAQEEPDLAGIDEPLRGLIADCLAKDPAVRPTPEEVAARVQPVATGTSSPPWLPAQIIAELGRSAVELLDTDTPAQASAAVASDPGAPVPSPPPGVSAASPGAFPATWEETPVAERSEWRTQIVPKPDLASAEPVPTPTPAPSPRPRRAGRGRWAAIALAAAAVVTGAAFAASAAGLPLPFGGSDSGSGSGSGEGGPAAEVPESSDVPKEFVGIWAGEVERDGKPTGQYRRFAVSPGQLGEIVATSISLGKNYECKSDGKLTAKPSGGTPTALRLDTRVVSSVPADTCSALGEHVLSRTAGDSLRWEAAGRTAELHRIQGPEKLPQELLGTWKRPLARSR